jgi:hypothetical protein
MRFAQKGRKASGIRDGADEHRLIATSRNIFFISDDACVTGVLG